VEPRGCEARTGTAFLTLFKIEVVIRVSVDTVSNMAVPLDGEPVHE
jgi:hypothetical protein